MASVAVPFLALGCAVGFFVGAVFALTVARRHSLF